MMKCLFTSICFVFSTAVFAQEDIVVTQKGDTLRGDARILSYDLVDRVQLAADKKKTTYTALQVRRATIGGELYFPVRFENSVRLMKSIRSGFLSLYAYRAPGQSGYDTRVLQKVGDRAIEVPNIAFKKFVGDIVEACPDVAEKIKKGDLGRNDVEKIVDEYNLCVEEGNQRRLDAAASARTPVADLVEQMKLKVTASDITNKTEINDLLTSIADKYKRKETVPAYMKEGLKGYLGSRDDLKTDMEQLISLVEKQ